MLGILTFHEQDNDRGEAEYRAVDAWKATKFPNYWDEVNCFWCDRPLKKWQATCDHIKPRWMGGRTIASNLEIACNDCNQSRRVISQIASVCLRVLQNRKQRPVAERRAALRVLIKERNRMLPALAEVEIVYHARLSGNRLKACLREIDYLYSIEEKL